MTLLVDMEEDGKILINKQLVNNHKEDWKYWLLYDYDKDFYQIIGYVKYDFSEDS